MSGVQELLGGLLLFAALVGPMIFASKILGAFGRVLVVLGATSACGPEHMVHGERVRRLQIAETEAQARAARA